MTDHPPPGGRGRGTPSCVSMVTPAGRGHCGTSGILERAGGGQTRIPRRGTAPPGGFKAPYDQNVNVRRVTGSEIGTQVPPLATDAGPPNVRSALETVRDEMLATASQALSLSPAGQSD